MQCDVLSNFEHLGQHAETISVNYMLILRAETINHCYCSFVWVCDNKRECIEVVFSLGFKIVVTIFTVYVLIVRTEFLVQLFCAAPTLCVV